MMPQTSSMQDHIGEFACAKFSSCCRSKLRHKEVKMENKHRMLPADFCSRMKRMLSEQEYEAFLASYVEEPVQGLRVNNLKLSVPAFLNKVPEWQLQSIPWTENGFYFRSSETLRPGKHPYHEAGAYYIQEPSAMAVAMLSGARPGERILDLCAAPGGKTTQLAGMLQGEGLLISNEIHPVRAQILSQNVERMGIRNAIVTNETPDKLAGYFPAFFDRVIVDAPCSGEGMFRKDPQAIEQWSKDNVTLCADRQQEILAAADRMLCDGGRLIYSTCTFAPEEDEGSIARFILQHPEYHVVDVWKQESSSETKTAWREHFDHGCPAWAFTEQGKADFISNENGQTEGSDDSEVLRDKESTKENTTEHTIEHTIRLWPHHLQGEGHFVAVLQKEGETAPKICTDKLPGINKNQMDLWRDFCAGFLKKENMFSAHIPVVFGDNLYLMPAALNLKGIKVLRAGLQAGVWKKNRFEPAHALALALHPEDVKNVCALDSENGQLQEAIRYLKGETLSCDPKIKGWTLVTIDGLSLGWGKAAGGILKNHYPKGLRWMG